MSAPTNAELADQIAVLRRIVAGLTAEDVRTESEIAQAEKDAEAAEKAAKKASSANDAP